MKRPCQTEFIQSHARRCKFSAAVAAVAAVAAAIQTSVCISNVFGIICVGVCCCCLANCLCAVALALVTMHPLLYTYNIY